MQSQFLIVGFIAIVIWLGLITSHLLNMRKKYSVFTEGVGRKTLEDVLTNIVKEQRLSKKDIALLRERCDMIEKDGMLHIQKIGLLRFNPFKDTGGDQSFILSLINGQDSGVVITALYSRSGTRWYAKRVASGKGVEHELSEDEKKSLSQAQGMK